MAKLDLTVDVDVKNADKLRGLGSTLGSAAINVAKVGAAAGAAFAGVGAFTANFASDLNESLSKVGVVFDENAQAIEDWSKDAAAAMGISQQQALESVGTFGNLFTAMDIGQKPAAEMSTQLTELASDLASFNNATPEEVLVALRAGLLGEAEPLRRFGVQISAARIEQEALAQGLVDTKEELTPAIKAQAAYSLILQDTANAQGDFARTSDGMANQQRILAATFDDTMATIGQAFVPIIQELLPGITAGLQGFAGWVTANLPTIQEVAGTVFGAIGSAISFLFTEVVPRLVEAFQWVATNVFPSFAQAGGIISGTVMPAITSAISFVVDNVLPGLLSVFQGIVQWVSANWPKISSVIGQVFGAVVNVVKSVWPVIESVASVLFPLVATGASVLFSALDVTFKAIGGIFEVLGNTFESIGKVIKRVFRGIAFVAETVWDTVTSAVKGGINFIIDVINGLIGALNSIRIGIPEVGIPGTDIRIGGGHFDPFNLPTIPRLAAGGIVNSPTLALIGEAGPEAVVPLDRSPLAPITIEVNVLGDLRAEDEESVAEAIARVLWSTGMTTDREIAYGR